MPKLGKNKKPKRCSRRPNQSPNLVGAFLTKFLSVVNFKQTFYSSLNLKGGVKVAAPNTNIKFTYRDYKSLPPSETKIYMLLDGEIIMVPAPAPYHQRVSGNVEHILQEFV